MSTEPSPTIEYRIGSEDLIEINVFDVPELSRTVRVSISGDISLPMVGQVRASGLTALELEKDLTERLQKSYIKDPQVSVFVREFKSDPVSVVGAVQMPGLYYIQTPKRLLEVLAMARGFNEPPRAPGHSIIVVRRRPVDAKAAASADSTEKPTLEIPIAGLVTSTEADWNVIIYPGDTIKVPPSPNVFVAGDVQKPGAFPLSGYDRISAIQALAMAGGPMRTAKTSNAVIIQTDAAGNRTEQKVNLHRVLKGEDPDFLLAANDILFIPGNRSKIAALRALEAGIQVSTGLLIWGR